MDLEEAKPEDTENTSFLKKCHDWKYTPHVIFFLLFSNIACVYHFVFEFLDEPAYLKWLMPINEAVFEHTKLIIWPWVVMGPIWFTYRKKKNLNYNNILSGIVIGLFTGYLMIPIFYTYTGAFSGALRSVLAVDIIYSYILFGLVIYYAECIWRKEPYPIHYEYISGGLIVFILVLHSFWSYKPPPNIPLFMDWEGDIVGWTVANSGHV